MPNFEAIIDLIERCKAPYLRISDNRGNKIMCIDHGTTRATIDELEAIKPMLMSYGSLEILAANAEQFKSNFKGAYKWILAFDKAPGTTNTQQNQMGAMPWTGFNWGQPPPGFVSNDIMLAKLAEIELRMKYEKELSDLKAKLGKRDDDPIAKYAEYVPVMGAALGWPDEKIERMMKYYMMGKGAKNVAGMPDVSNTLTFKDVDKMSFEEKSNKIQSLLESVGKKVELEKIIKLFEAVDKNPVLAEKAVGILSTL